MSCQQHFNFLFLFGGGHNHSVIHTGCFHASIKLYKIVSDLIIQICFEDQKDFYWEYANMTLLVKCLADLWLASILLR